jgi:hypothetical protein
MTKCILAALICAAASAQQFTFQSPSSYATQKAPLAMTTGDFNGDGKLDLLTANAGSQTVSVFLGKSDGTFQAPASYALRQVARRTIWLPATSTKTGIPTCSPPVSSEAWWSFFPAKAMGR